MNVKVKELAREIARHYNIRYKVATYLVKAGFDSVEAIDAATDDELLTVNWVGPKVLAIIRGEDDPGTAWNYNPDGPTESDGEIVEEGTQVDSDSSVSESDLNIVDYYSDVPVVDKPDSQSGFNLEINTEGSVDDLEVILDTMLHVICSDIRMKGLRYSLQFRIS